MKYNIQVDINCGMEWSNKIINIRALAILLVVFGHSIILYSSSWNLYSTLNDVPVLDYIKKIIDLIQMPIFFSISGYLFLYTHRQKGGIGKLIKNKIKRLIVPYFIIGLVYMVPIKLAVGYSSYQDKTLFDLCINFFKVEDVGHLWFLPTLFWIFIISEIALSAIEKIPIIEKFPEIALFLISAVLYLEGYRIAFVYSPLMAAFSYMIWFAWGYMICVYQRMIRKAYSKIIIECIAILLSMGLLGYCSYHNTRVIVELFCRSLCILNLYGLIPQKTNKIAKKISEDSFGIYLFHSPLIYFTYAFISNASPILVVTLNFIIFGLTAMMFTEIIRHFNLSFIIGEKNKKKMHKS